MASQGNDRIRDLGNENRKDKEKRMTGIFYNSKLPEKLRKDLDKKLECKETTKSIPFALACSAGKPKAEVKDETDDCYSAKMRQVKKRPEDHENWRIRDSQMYFFRPDPLKSSLLPDINPWKLVVPKKLRPQVLKENHDGLQSGHLGSEKHSLEY